jgi:hypothetical protein
MVPVTVSAAFELMLVALGVTVMAETNFATVTVAVPLASAKFVSPL